MWPVSAAPVTAVIPLKALHAAKGRLADALDREQRRALVERMFLSVLDACRSAEPVTDVLVVAGDDAGAELALSEGVRAVVPPGVGLPAALEHADRLLAGERATLVVAADLPLLSAEDVRRVCSAGVHERAVVIAPTWDGGTGGLLRMPGDVIGTAYGVGSAAAHRRLAEAAGLEPVLLELEGFRLDVDTAEQLAALRERHPGLEAGLLPERG